MPPQLEANKKQHLQHWEESMHLIFTHHASIFLIKLHLTVKTHTETHYGAIRKKNIKWLLTKTLVTNQ